MAGARAGQTHVVVGAGDRGTPALVVQERHIIGAGHCGLREGRGNGRSVGGERRCMRCCAPVRAGGTAPAGALPSAVFHLREHRAAEGDEQLGRRARHGCGPVNERGAVGQLGNTCGMAWGEWGGRFRPVGEPSLSRHLLLPVCSAHQAGSKAPGTVDTPRSTARRNTRQPRRPACPPLVSTLCAVSGARRRRCRQLCRPHATQSTDTHEIHCL